MRRLSIRSLLALLLAACCTALSGCDATIQPENQAFAMSMSVDLTEDGEKLELGVLIPTLTNASSGSSSESPDSNYIRYFVVSDSFDACLNTLQSIMPLSLNLSQLKSVVISQELAQTDVFKVLIRDMMMTNHLYNTTYLCIALGSARAVLESEQPLVAGRLSMQMDAAYEHYGLIGYVPLTKLGDMYYHMASVYGEPFCMLVATADHTKERLTMPEGLLGDALPGKLPVESESKNQYMGSALFRDGRMVGVLDGAETQWARVLAGEITSVQYYADGSSLRLAMRRKPKVSVDLSGSAPKIAIHLSMAMTPQQSMPDEQIIQKQIRAQLENLFVHIKSLGVDPVFFGMRAATQFATVDQFVAYGWLDRIKDAQFAVTFDIKENYKL